MRKTVVIVVLLALAWLGYVAWPIYTLAVLARAIEAGDIATAMRHVDLPAVRQSITDQVVDTYLKLTGKTASPLLRGAVTGAAGSIADPIVGQIVVARGDRQSSCATAGRLRCCRIARPAWRGLSSAALGSRGRSSPQREYGIRRFEIEVPPSLPRERRFVARIPDASNGAGSSPACGCRSTCESGWPKR